MRLAIVVGMVVVAVCAAGAGQASGISDSKSQISEHRALLDAIRTVESGGKDGAVGDGGRSLGAYQIGRAYWADACDQGGVSWDYDSLVRSQAHCEQIMVWYWARYHATTDEQRARIHNGGPSGMKKKATLGYWRKVNRQVAKDAKGNGQ